MNLENILETIRLLTVKVETNREKGTGVLIVQNGRAYVVTVYHCIYGKAKSPPNIQIDNITFKFDSKLTTEEIKPLSIESYREKIVLLEVEIARLRVEGVENFILLDRVYYDKSYHLRGYPKGLSHGHFFEAKCKDKSLDDIGFSIEVNSLTEDTSGDDIIESVAGLSGSGVFFSENGRLYLVGLVNSLATDGGLFNIVYAVKLIDLKEADIALSQYQEKKIVYSTAPKQLTSKLGKSTIIGRKKELKEIDNLLKTNNSLLLITGIGGIGKSTIASYYLHSQKRNFDYYGFFEGLDSFVNELKPRLNLQAEKPDELFLEALAKLGSLEGSKLLVLDDVKDSEKNQEVIDKIFALRHSGYKILITSREDIENIEPYYLDVLSLQDAKELFNSIYEIEDEALLEEILEYLDYHAFFIEKTAHSIKKTLTPQMIRDKFKSGEFSQISLKRKQSFDKFLNELFTFDRLDEEEILMLKQFSALPSIEIAFEFLENIFKETEKKKNRFNWSFLKFWQKKYTYSNMEELLDFLSEKGWLTKLEGGYKLHQIIKEYLLANHTPSFEEIEVVVDSFNAIIDNSAEIQVAVDNRENIVYFESLVDLLDRLEIENKKVGDFFERLGNISKSLAFYQKAESFLSKALKIRENFLGENHHSTASSYNNLAGLYLSMGEYQKAEPLYLNALKVVGEEYPSTYNNLAELYRSMGEYQKAESLSLKALKISEKVLGKEHAITAFSYANKALLYHNMGEYKKAESLSLKALKIREKVLGEDHPDTATSYNNLAGVYDSMGDYQKAVPLYLKALKIRKKVLGEEHPDTAIIYSNLGDFYYDQGDYKEAYDYMKKAVEVLSKVLPSNHPNLIDSKEGLELIEKML